jgi:hypothetical protein
LRQGAPAYSGEWGRFRYPKVEASRRLRAAALQSAGEMLPRLAPLRRAFVGLFGEQPFPSAVLVASERVVAPQGADLLDQGVIKDQRPLVALRSLRASRSRWHRRSKSAEAWRAG